MRTSINAAGIRATAVAIVCLGANSLAAGELPVVSAIAVQDQPKAASTDEDSADSAPLESNSKNSEKSESVSDKAPATKKPRLSPPSDLDRELLKDLVPDLNLGPLESADPEKTPVDADRPDELDRAVDSMRRVSSQLSKNELTEEVASLQKSVLEDIDALIERLKQPPQQSQQNNDPNQNQNDQQQDQQNQAQKNRREQQGNQPRQQTGSRSGSRPQPRPTAGKSRNSQEENLRDPKNATAELARRRALINEIWGHYPALMREKLLNVGDEKMLPKYEDLIRRYYKSLTDSATSDKKRRP